MSCIVVDLMLYLQPMTSPDNRDKAVAVQTLEEERYRLALWLQSNTGHLLANAALEIDSSLQIMSTQPRVARQGLTALSQELRQGLDQLRGLIAELQPPLLEELGLAPSIEKYTVGFTRRTGIAVTLKGWDSLVERLPSTVEMAIFRIIQEALENVRDHSHATQVELSAQMQGRLLQITVNDNGKGFDPGRGVQPRRRLGLAAMRDRAESIGGSLRVFTKAERGVRVVFTAPLRLHNTMR